MQIQNFDATNIPPVQQAGGKHPEGKNFPFQITNTYGQENSNKDGGMLVIEFTSPAGSIKSYYNLFNKNDITREIAHKQLSTLCRAVGVMHLSFVNTPMDQWAKELRTGRGVMDIGPQTKDPQYNEVKMIYDANGVDPTKGNSGAAPAPQTQPGGSWGAPATGQAPAQNNAPAANSGGGWGQPGGMQQQPAAQQQAPAGNGGAAKPPWAS